MRAGAVAFIIFPTPKLDIAFIIFASFIKGFNHHSE